MRLTFWGSNIQIRPTLLMRFSCIWSNWNDIAAFFIYFSLFVWVKISLYRGYRRGSQFWFNISKYTVMIQKWAEVLEKLMMTSESHAEFHLYWMHRPINGLKVEELAYSVKQHQTVFRVTLSRKSFIRDN